MCPPHMILLYHASCLSKTPCESVLADITLPISPRKCQETIALHPKFFGAFLSMESWQNASQLRNVRQTNACVLLLKNPSSCVLSHACFSKTSFHLCLLQENTPSRVCPSKTPANTFQRTLKFPLQKYKPNKPFYISLSPLLLFGHGDQSYRKKDTIPESESEQSLSVSTSVRA